MRAKQTSVGAVTCERSELLARARGLLPVSGYDAMECLLAPALHTSPKASVLTLIREPPGERTQRNCETEPSEPLGERLNLPHDERAPRRAAPTASCCFRICERAPGRANY